MDKSKRLDEIVLLAMGPSWSLIPEKKENTEIWGCNTMYRNIKLDKVFLMHDVMYDMVLQDKDIVKTVNELNLPIYTAGPHPEFNNNVVYPLKEVIDEFNVVFYLNVIAYMLAYAIIQNPKQISLYGVDMRTDTGTEYNKNEKGCIEFWLGVATGRNIVWKVPNESFLAKRSVCSNFYGFQARKTPEGLVHLVPRAGKKIWERYKMIPLDEQGNEVTEDIVITDWVAEEKQN